jgi:hypothetical protein
MDKKAGILVSLILIILAINFISAAYFGSYNPRQGMQDVINGVVDFSEPLLQVLFGNYVWTGYLLFEAFLLFIILVAIVYLSLKNVEIFESNPAVLWIITLAVPLIGIRFIQFDWFVTILIQYKVLAIALLAGLPFIIYFLFLYNVLADYGVLRKIAWVFFAVIFLGLWFTTPETNYGEVYLWTAFLALLFLMMDGTIRRALIKQRMNALGAANVEDLHRKLRNQIRDVDADLANNIITARQHAKIKRRIQGQINSLLKN